MNFQDTSTFEKNLECPDHNKSPESTNGSALVIGAYAAQSPSDSSPAEFIDAISSLPNVDGLEIPFGSTDYLKNSETMWELLPHGGKHVFTLIGATMETLEKDPDFGLASPDTAGRLRALELLKSALDEAKRLKKLGHNVIAIEAHSAPRTASKEALIESLSKARQWNWDNVTLTVEHCDSMKVIEGTKHYEAKGFLSLEEEIEAVNAVLNASTGLPNTPSELGITINWGRSAIDGKNPSEVIRQIQLVREAGLLRGLIFSGAGATDSDYGRPWDDRHLPMYSNDHQCGCPESLLTDVEVEKCLKAAGKNLLFKGVKITVQPVSASNATRATHISRALSAVDR